MLPVSKEAKPQELCGPPVLFLTLDRNMNIESVEDEILAFIRQSHGESVRTVDDILSSRKEDVIKSLETAFNGRPSELRFMLESRGRIFHYELHCFPDIQGREGSINSW